MKHEDLIRQMSLEEKCYFLSGKDFWQTRSVERLGVPNMTLSDGPHGIRKQAGEGDHPCPPPASPPPLQLRTPGIPHWGRKSANIWVSKPLPRGWA